MAKSATGVPPVRWAPKPEIFFRTWFDTLLVRIHDSKSDTRQIDSEAETALVVQIILGFDWPVIERAVGLASPALEFRADAACGIAFCLLLPAKVPQKGLNKQNWIELAARFTAAAKAVRQLDAALARVPEWLEDHPRQTIAPLPEYFEICASAAHKHAASSGVDRGGHPRLREFTHLVLLLWAAFERATGRQITKGGLARAVDTIGPGLRKFAEEIGVEFPLPNSSEACRKFVAGLFTEKTPAVVQEVRSFLTMPALD